MTPDLPLSVDAAGRAAAVNHGLDESASCALLVGPSGARAGIRIGVPCRLELDDASPWRFAAIGEVDRRSPRAVPMDQDWVVLLPDGGDVRHLRDVARFYGSHVRIVYATPTRTP
jgi:hypothetical protein